MGKSATFPGDEFLQLIIERREVTEELFRMESLEVFSGLSHTIVLSGPKQVRNQRAHVVLTLRILPSEIINTGLTIARFPVETRCNDEANHRRTLETNRIGVACD